MTEGTADFRLDPGLDVAAAAERFARVGRLHLPAVLEHASADAMERFLACEADWKLIFNHGEKLYELDAAAQRSIGPGKLDELTRSAQNSGRNAFQYLYESRRVDDDPVRRADDPSLIARFAEFLNGEVFLDFARRITNCPEIVFVDCQGTCYRHGHFLTTHDDDVAGKHRVAAYVFNFTREWRPEWGGQLQFLGADGHVVEGFVPRFNALNVLRVPQPHLVSIVTPLARPGAARFSVTGWFRTRAT